MARPDSYRRFGSIRILRDGRVRFSTWTFPVLSYISFLVMNPDHISMEVQGKWVMDFDLQRGRMLGAGFRYDLTPDEFRSIVSDLRRAGNGLERWIVPSLEFTSLASTFRQINPKAYAVMPEILESCRDLPVAEQWQRVRAKVIANETKRDKGEPHFLKREEQAPGAQRKTLQSKGRARSRSKK